VRGEGILTAIQRNIIRIHKKNPQRAVYTNERNYLGAVVYSALQKRYFLPDFPIIAESLLERWRRLLLWYLTKIHTKKM
jgi:hypothetical protein